MNDEPQDCQSAAALITRLDELEMRVAFLDELTESLNGVIADQNQQLLVLQTQMKLLYQRVQAVKVEDDGVAPFDVYDDRPPHY
ncbi:MAG: SlyX family protein [Pseudomonadota bacterium]|nr:SlyX family protein [Pseudomonadota bacterium]